MKSSVFLLFLFSLVVISCVTTQKAGTDVVNSWVGSTKVQLVQKLGPPTRIASDEAGGEIYIYELSAPQQNPGRIYSSSNHISYTTPQTQHGALMLFINKAGTIYHGSYRDY